MSANARAGAALSRARVALAYRWRHGRWPALDAPKRFTEWVQWRKLNDRTPGRSLLTDKAHSKRLAGAALGERFVIPTVWEGAVLPADPPHALPLVVKANHGCRQAVIVRTMADYQRARRVSPAWLKRDYGGWLDEWHYRGAARSILVEPCVGADGVLPVDYKFYVFGGRAAMIQVHEERGGDHRWSQYGVDWTPLSRSRSALAPPDSLAEMIEAAERLGDGHDFVRVDFYEVDGQPLFGEFCLYPGSGLDPFDPVDLDLWLGGLWSAQHPASVAEGARQRPGGARALGHEPQLGALA